jgi:hypothetical protein
MVKRAPRKSISWAQGSPGGEIIKDFELPPLEMNNNSDRPQKRPSWAGGELRDHFTPVRKSINWGERNEED